MTSEGRRSAILDGLREALVGGTKLRDILRYHIGMIDEQGNASHCFGKLLRPSLVLLTAEGLGGDAGKALGAAVALELVHNFSLIHDDIQDRDEVRRGRPTVWAIHGVAEAINAGDLMLAIALSKAIESGAVVAATVARAVERMIEGQSLDLDFESRAVDTDEYLDMIDRKAGALLSCALELGGIVASASDEVIERLAALGRSIGRAFQIQDDLLGVWGDGDVVGKPQGSDIRRRKKSFPVAVAFAESTGEDKRRLEAIYAGDRVREDDVEWVIGLLDRLGTRSRGEAAVGEALDEARDLLNRLPFSDAGLEEMQVLTERLAGRKK